MSGDKNHATTTHADLPASAAEPSKFSAMTTDDGQSNDVSTMVIAPRSASNTAMKQEEYELSQSRFIHD